MISRQTEKQPFVIFAALNASLGFFLYMYTISVFNPIQEVLTKYIFPNSSIMEQSLFASSPLFGGAVGSFITESIGKKLGRKSTMIFIHLIGIVGVILTMFPNTALFIIGRTLTGFQGGVAVVIVNIYITEISEDPLRGQLGIVPPIAGALAVLITFLMGMLMPYFVENGVPELGCRIFLGLPALISLIKIINLLFIFNFETPFYLVTQEEKTEAKEVLKLLYSEGHTIILDDIVKEKEFVFEEKGITISDLFTNKYRRALIVSLLLSFCPSTAGGVVPLVFSNMVFSEGLETAYTSLPLILTGIIGVIYLSGNLLALVLIKYYGRRTLSIWGSSFLSVINLAITLITFLTSVSSTSVRVLILCWAAVYNLALNSLGYYYPAEALPELGVGVVSTFSFIVSFVMTQIFMPLRNSIGYAGIYLIFTCFALLQLTVVATYQVETKGRTKLEVYTLYAKSEEDEKSLIDKYS